MSSAEHHNHGQSNGQKNKFRAMAIPRKRAVTACETCRVKKTKCDNRRPQCSSCLSHSWPCSYDPRLDHSSFDPASLLILDKLDQTLHKLNEIGNTPCTGAHIVGTPPTKHPQHSDSDSDCLEVPTVFGSAEQIFTWPIFHGRWTGDILSKEILADNQSSPPACRDEQDARTKRSKPGINEEDIPYLVENFLQRVHSKNPIFEARRIREAAKRVAEDGVSWDPSSCLVLLACALGTLAPLCDPVCEAGQLHNRTSLEESVESRTYAETYYQLACRRLGLLDHSLIASQCYVLSGIYLMYTLRPLRGWAAFHQAGSVFSLYLKGQVALQERHTNSSSAPLQSLERPFEQRLYWTILKSECEFRVQLDVPQSDLCKLGYPYLFPSPPAPSSPIQSPQDINQMSIPAGISPSQISLTSTVCSAKLEEQSWFYYLSEIALRRVENRVLSTLFKEDHHHWSRANFSAMVSFAKDIEAQLDNWYTSLPELIRFDSHDPVQQLDELRLVTRGRAQCIKSLLYRPFLYYAVHCADQVSDNDMRMVLEEYMQKSLNCCLELSSGSGMTHRHHGTWYGLREAIVCGMTIHAARLGGLITTNNVLPDGQVQENQYGRAVQINIEKLRFWEAESPADIARAREILEKLSVDAGLRGEIPV